VGGVLLAFPIKAARRGFLFCELSSLSRHQRKKRLLSNEHKKTVPVFRNG